MKRYVEGLDRQLVTLLPKCLEDFISEDNPVRVIDAFVDELDLASAGFEGAALASTAQRNLVAEVHPGAEASIAAAIAGRDDVQADTGFEEPPAPDVPASCWLQPQLQADVRLSGITHDERAPCADNCLDLPSQPALLHTWRTTPWPQRAGREG
jgi:hypothetical protein